MAQIHKRDLGGVVKIGEDLFDWSLHREPQFCERDGYKGVSISVTLQAFRGRELLLEYPYVHSIARHHRRPKPSDASLIKHIGLAIEAGWDPASRGKAFAFQVTDQA